MALDCFLLRWEFAYVVDDGVDLGVGEFVLERRHFVLAGFNDGVQFIVRLGSHHRVG